MYKHPKIRKLYQQMYYVAYKRNFYALTSPLRVLPDFIIIGTVRSGTTSLYYTLCEHSCIAPASYDEIGFFDSNFELGINWYKSLFPTIIQKKYVKSRHKNFITGEDTPFYFWNKKAAERIIKIIPSVKLITILRNPVDRAYSNYNLGKRLGTENLSFEDAIKLEIEDLEKDPDFSKNLIKFSRPRSYIAKGFYADQLEIWLKLFQRDHILILNTEEFSREPQKTLKKSFEFLNLPYEKIENIKNLKAAKYLPMKTETRKFLLDYFKLHNEKLYRLIDVEFDWEK
jgi:hypothetical protein